MGFAWLAAPLLLAACAPAAAGAAGAARLPPAKAVVSARCYLSADAATVRNVAVKRAAPPWGDGAWAWLCAPSAADAARAPDAELCLRTDPVVAVEARGLPGGVLGALVWQSERAARAARASRSLTAAVPRASSPADAAGATVACGGARGGESAAFAAAGRGRHLSSLAATCHARGGVARVTGARFAAQAAGGGGARGAAAPLTPAYASLFPR
jgi:hypothetical protein